MHVYDLFKLNEKTAIVTGGGRGLGAQIAESFAEAGANVVVCSRNLDACQEMSDKLKKMGVDSLAFACDVTKQEDIQRVVRETYNHFGKIDILVNNSGASWGAPVLEMPLKAWNKVMDVNVNGVFLMSQEVGKIMVNQKQGKIINIASVAGLTGADPSYLDAIGYNASKGAVVNFTRDLAAKWGQYNINVNAIAPGFFPTKMSKGVLEQAEEKILELTPLNRLGNNADLKGSALFLASDASNYVTGTILAVDGGMHAV
ncbi:glucose 1-dehydrogenase [Oceanobacillus piezotolerans]|uniref:Glucose 1-dehydrogenase n=1 Tax=Oceanobacillus piezotolerans TaxID=2448030 RepID=A0A498D8F5_9BACI|nr:SDR family oxidoreductase [Oceanobacillus piezotolerans]RLL46826.1 glucose 1-dehydrogenase [Oceanobacillus piezotolerans]